ncbi:MAG TPA: site-2 protease family protein [Actinomycetota bacterium]
MSSANPLIGRVIVLFRVRGIEIAFTPSWLATVVVLSLIFRQSELIPVDIGRVAGAAMAVGLTMLFYSFVLIHEAAHTFVAQAFGLQPRRILLFMLGGVSQIGRDAEGPKQEYLVALAGPLASLVIAGILSMLAVASGGSFTDAAAAGDVWATLAAVNLLLAMFNLIPGFPLDGGRVLRATIWAVTGDRIRATRMAANGGRIVAGGFVAGGVAYLLWQTQGVGDFFPGVLYIALGWFLYSHASFAGSEDVHREMVREQARRDAMAAAPPAPPARDIVPRAAKRRVTSKAAPTTLAGPVARSAKKPERKPPERKPKRKPAKKAAGAKPARKAAKKTAAPSPQRTRKATKTDEGDAAKSEASARRRGRAKRPATAAKAGAESRDRARDSRRRPAHPRRGADGSR